MRIASAIKLAGGFCALALTTSLGAQATCDSLTIRAQTDTARVGMAALRAILQPSYVPSSIDPALARIDSIARARCLVVVPPPTPTPTPAPTPQPPPTSSGFPKIGVAEVPRVQLDPARPAGTYAQIHVTSCNDLTAALAAQTQTEVILSRGLRCSMHVRLPARSQAQGWLVLRTDGYTHTLGDRMTPTKAAANRLARIDVPSNMSWAVTMAAGAGYYRFEGIEIGLADAVTEAGAIVVAGTENLGVADLALGPIHFIGSYIHGRQGANTVRCILMHAPKTIVEDSDLDECQRPGADTQAIAAWNSNGPFRIVNNYLAGCAENLMFGGANPSAPGAIVQDVEIRRNYFHTPLAWKAGGCRINKKNLLEMKAAQRVYIAENVFDGSWNGGHNGIAWVLKSSANQSASCKHCSTSDITLVDNLIVNVAAWLDISGSNAGPTDSTTRRITVQNVLVDGEIATADYNSSGLTRPFSISGGHDIEISNFRVADYSALNNEALAMYGAPVPRLTIRNGVLKRGRYGVFGNGEGTPTFTKWAPGIVWQNMAILGANVSIYPAGTRNTAGPTDGVDPAALKAKLSGVVVPR